MGRAARAKGVAHAAAREQGRADGRIVQLEPLEFERLGRLRGAVDSARVIAQQEVAEFKARVDAEFRAISERHQAQIAERDRTYRQEWQKVAKAHGFDPAGEWNPNDQDYTLSRVEPQR